MEIRDTPIGMVVLPGTKEEVDRYVKLLFARRDFVIEYGKIKGYPEKTDDWTIDQILELHDQPGWVDPFSEKK